MIDLKEDKFCWSDEREPHFKRRKAILTKYPEVKRLVGPDIKLALATLFLVSFQLTSAIYANRLLDLQFGLLWYALAVYIVGATVTHALFLAIHEITHNMAFKKETPNNWLALFANIPIVFPYAISFKAYHTMHHRQQGVDGIDVDVPSYNEVKVFQGTIGKLLWAFIQILFYALRPFFVYPLKPDKWLITNIIFQFSVIGVFIWFAGWYALLYLLLADFIAGSLHPISGHFVAEHYIFKEGQETYSYYGWLNIFAFNVGYHNEHHDFPSIPGSRLPQLRKMAPDFYDNLYIHKSWVNVLVQFIINPNLGLYSRMKRRA
ncbi:MAG: fatty acid desaturase [Bacteroidales bacterium]